MQEVYKLLLPLKSWLSEQEDKMNSMKPAAVLSPPLAAQITENEVSDSVHLFVCPSLFICGHACTRLYCYIQSICSQQC